MDDLLQNPVVRDALRKAWQDSSPGVFGGHEEGGFILADENDRVSVARWPRGIRSFIEVPPHPSARFDGKRVLATFHTHPNTGRTFDPEPSEGDVEGVQGDADLKASYYRGELVISAESVYHILPYGDWYTLTQTRTLIDGSDSDR